MRHGLAIAGILDLQGRRFSELFPHPQPVVRYAPEPSRPRSAGRIRFGAAARAQRRSTLRESNRSVEFVDHIPDGKPRMASNW